MRKHRDKSVVMQDQRVFAEALLDGMTPKQARELAGTNVVRGETVKRYIAEARAELEDVTTLKRIDVINIMLEAVDMARTLADPSQMINGADKLAKMMGYYAPESVKVDVNVNGNLMATKIRSLSDEELYRLASKKDENVVDAEVIND